MKPFFRRWASALACRGTRSSAKAFVGGAARSWASALVCGALGGCVSQRGPDLGATTRLVVAPSAIAVLTPGEARSTLPAQLELGGTHGRSALYLKFPSEFRAPQTPRAAFVALSLGAGSASANPVVLEAWRVTSAWDPKELVNWSDKPPLAPPFARARLSGGDGADAVRIDVSELVQFAAQHPDLDFGIALVARGGGSGRGLSVTTGIAGGRAPRLEVYVR